MITLDLAFHRLRADGVLEYAIMRNATLRGKWCDYPFADLRHAVAKSGTTPKGEGWFLLAYSINPEKTDFAVASSATIEQEPAAQ